MYKFKKGDRVENLEATDYVKKGATGTVDQNNSHCPLVIWDSQDMLTKRGQCSDRLWSQHENKLELITDESTPPKESAPLYGGKTEEWWLWHYAGHIQVPDDLSISYAKNLNQSEPPNDHMDNMRWWTSAEAKWRVMHAQALIDELKKQKQ